MLKKSVAVSMLIGAAVSGALGVYWRDDPAKQVWIILVLSIGALVYEGINACMIAWRKD